MTTEDTVPQEEGAFPNTDAQQQMFGLIMMELMQSERFVTFINTNFDIQTAVDHETSEIMIRVVEVPPEVVMERIKELAGVDTSQKAQEEEPKPKKVGKKLIAPPNTSPSKIVENKMKKKIVDKAVQLASREKKIIV